MGWAGVRSSIHSDQPHAIFIFRPGRKISIAILSAHRVFVLPDAASEDSGATFGDAAVNDLPSLKARGPGTAAPLKPVGEEVM